jgi:hypothetical protein
VRPVTVRFKVRADQAATNQQVAGVTTPAQRGSRSVRRRRRTHARAPPDVVLELLDELW